jgi:cold shock CspA family protein
MGFVTNIVAAKGFFFCVDEFRDSFYAHCSQLLNIELDELKSGQAVTFTVHRASRGPAASNVVAIF